MNVAYKTQNEYHEEARYTYEDYITWNDDIRCELIDGVPYMMASPSIIHQRILGRIFMQFSNYLMNKTCEVFIAPADVRLNADYEDNTVVQPDIFIVCDKSKLENGKSCKGAPDMVVEILSPSSKQWDYLVKYKKYLDAGVSEYWIVDPEEKTVQQFILKGKKYYIKSYIAGDIVPIHVLPGFEINLADIFPDAQMPQPGNPDQEEASDDSSN